MRIEVATMSETNSRNKKGDLLEELVYEFAKTRGLSVIKELRSASSEIDLHCTDDSTGETIYIECKAHRDPLSKSTLTNLIGVVYGENYSQGWLISTGPISKDAKGYIYNWQKKDLPERAKLKVHFEEELALLFIKSRIVEDPSAIRLDEYARPGHHAPTWVLLITEFGRFWTAPKFQGGIATQVYVLNANDSSKVIDRELLTLLSRLDSSWEGRPFVSGSIESIRRSEEARTSTTPPVIETVEGRRWSDYLPSRLQDFAGRKRELTDIIDFFENVRQGGAGPRVFAITGESGIGKSSLITSIRGKTRQRNYNKKFFAMAIDCRAAKTKDYINAALIRCLKKCRSSGFGRDYGIEFEITNPNHPLSSPSIEQYLNSVREMDQIVCLIFDQFEEIYSKQELSDVFAAAQDLFLSATSEAGPLVLGFAWRSNFAVQQDHPAYFMWQQLAGHRHEISLKPLVTSEVNSALSDFERELGSKLRIESKRQLIEAAKGYPWLLKKLCIHLFSQLKNLQQDQEKIENLSVESLFASDLRGLADGDKRALQFIAKNAPVAAYEVIEAYGDGALQRLEAQFLVTRSGEMLNIYWDIFKEYLLNGTVPNLPFSFLPASPSIASLLSVASQLHPNQPRSIESIAVPSQLAPRTVANVVRDLFIVGLATGTHAQPMLADGLLPSDARSIMRGVRSVLSKHTLLWELRNSFGDGSFTEAEMGASLGRIPSIPDYDQENILRHVRTLTIWFATAGFFVISPTGWRIFDIGDVDLSYADKSRGRSAGPFYGGSAPARALEVLSIVDKASSVDPSKIKAAGYRNAFVTLSRFGLIVKFEKTWNLVAAEKSEVGRSPLWRLHQAATKQDSLREVVRLIKSDRNMTGTELAQKLAVHFGEDWSDSSLIRTGNALKRWGEWLIECEESGTVVEPLEGVRGPSGQDTPEMMEEIEKLLKQGMPKQHVATKVGVSVMTLNRWISRRQSNIA